MTVQYPLFFIQRFKGKVLFNVPMSEHTSFRIGGAADVMAFPQDEGDLKDIITFAEAKNFPVYIFGSGTNILVKDGGIRGVVINMSEGFKAISWEAEKDGAMAAAVGAGVKLAELVSECKDRGASGIEFACSIPGTVGGAVAMNAGAYGAEMKDVVEAVEIMGKKGQRGFLSRDEIGFSYRKSGIPKGAVVTRAHMSFPVKDAEEIKQRIKEFREKRKDVAIPFPNAGSVFKNPEGDFAGRLIEEAGLKGQTSGSAAVSGVHANVIVNTGDAKARDVLALIALIRDRVYGMKGVVLEPEIKIIGED